MRTAITVALAIATLTLTATAHAQTVPVRLSTEASLARRIEDLPSPGKALVGSLVSTVAPLATAAGLAFGAILFGSSAMWISAAAFGASGLAIGPSIGQFYVGNTARGLLTALGRTTLIGGSVFFAIMSMLSNMRTAVDATDGGSNGDGSHPTRATAFLAASVGCALVAVGLAVWDIVDAPLAAKRRRREARRGLSIAPMLRSDANGGHTYGVAAAMTF